MDLIGHSLGRYHIIEQLGEGGMATVFKAYDTRLQRDVAVKVIRVDQFPPAALALILKRFEREARALAKLLHANIVHIHDFGEHEGVPYLVMDYLQGGTLKEKLGQPLPWLQAARLLLPVAQALAYAHRQGVIHRDVKPNNILIAQSGEPMLTDFGIAKILDIGATQSLTGSGVGIGTPEYMAPEQALGNKIDARVDVYALGVVFYEMLTGRKPFMADTPMAVVLKHISDPLPRPQLFVSDLPDMVDYVLIKALAKRPEDRYVDMDAMCQALEALSVASVSPPPVPVPVVQHVEEKASGQVSVSPTAGQIAARPAGTPDKLEPQASTLVLTPRQALLAANLQKQNVPEQSVPAPERTQPARQTKSLAPWIALGVVGLGFVGVLLIVLFIAVAGWMASGGAAGLFPTATPVFTPTASLTVTPSLTNTPVDTNTPTATQTLVPTMTPLATATSMFGIGSTLRREKDGMVMVYVPQGPFKMGSNADAAFAECKKNRADCERVWFVHEEPLHTVTLDPFWIDQTEVTNEMYAKCVKAGACKAPVSKTSRTRTSYYDNPDFTGFPVMNVDWNQANSYCIWAGARLPSEAEWEKAARGTDGRTYPWGEGIDNTYANYFSYTGDTTQVGFYENGKSPYGAYDMAGNVWEWVNDFYDSMYYQNSPSSNPTGPVSGEKRVLRGGSWVSWIETNRSAHRNATIQSFFLYDLGFRCLRQP